MRVPPLHRLLGLAGIYGQLRALRIDVGVERLRNDRQDRQMASLADNASKLLASETALEGEFSTLEAAYTALKNAPVQAGDTVTPETEAAIQQATDAFEALSAKMAAAASPAAPVADPATPTTEPTGDPAATSTGDAIPA